MEHCWFTPAEHPASRVSSIALWKKNEVDHSGLDYENVFFMMEHLGSIFGRVSPLLHSTKYRHYFVSWWFLKMYSAFAFYYLGSLASILLCNVISKAWCSISQCDIISQTEHAVGKKLISQSCGIITDTVKSDGFPSCFKGFKCSGWTLNWEHWRVMFPFPGQEGYFVLGHDYIGEWNLPVLS